MSRSGTLAAFAAVGLLVARVTAPSAGHDDQKEGMAAVHRPDGLTVISGTFHLGMGDTFDAAKAEALPAGTYGTWPAGMKHFVHAKGETVVQFHGDGPWAITYLDPADDPRNKKK